MKRHIQATLFSLGLLIALTCTAGCVGGDVEAQKYDSTQECWGPSEVVGDYSGPSGCDAASVIATDANGNYWRFPDTCTPDGFDKVTDADVQAELGGAPNCEN